MAAIRKHPKPEPSALALRIKAVRERADLTQSALAVKVGLTDSRSVWRYENENVVPEGETLAAIAKAGDVDCAWLITGAPEAAPSWFSAPDAAA
jgi:transcriptional regulator with XRE-family HTH domain